MSVDVQRTRQDIRSAFRKWDIDSSEWEIVWEADQVGGRRPGATVRYLRNGIWQSISSFNFPNRPLNLRQCFLLLDRLRIAEQSGVQYQGLTSTTDLARAEPARQKAEELLDAYDILGCTPDDPIELIRDVYRRKSMYYHPDKGGDAERFKRLNKAYERICESRGVKP